MIRVSIFFVLVVSAACGGNDDDPYADADPRCAAVCPIRLPAPDGAYDVCSETSARSCIDQCEVRFADFDSLCATCLVDHAQFGTGDDGGGSNIDCDGVTCTIIGRGGTCAYPQGDRAAEDDCIRVAYPRREVACEVDFRPVTECASVCAAG